MLTTSPWRICSITIAIIIACSGLVAAGEQSNPQQLLQQIKIKGADSVFNNELAGKSWLVFLTNVETGDSQWLKVAVAIYPVTDAGPAEDLTLAAGGALIRSPREVLLDVVPVIGIEGVCDYSEMTVEHRKVKTTQQAINDIDERINVLSKLTGSDVEEQKNRCVKILEKAKLQFE